MIGMGAWGRLRFGFLDLNLLGGGCGQAQGVSDLDLELVGHLGVLSQEPLGSVAGGT